VRSSQHGLRHDEEIAKHSKSNQRNIRALFLLLRHRQYFPCPSAAGTTLNEQAEPADQDVAVRHPALCFLHQGTAHTTPGLPVPEGCTVLRRGKGFLPRI